MGRTLNPMGTTEWCRACAVPLTPTDLDAGCCTNCGIPVTTMEDTLHVILEHMLLLATMRRKVARRLR